MLFSKEIFFVVVNLGFFPTVFSVYGEQIFIDIIEAPFIAAIYSNNEFVCTGTILNENNIITAAKCIKDHELAEICIKVGQENVNNDPEQCIRANEIITNSESGNPIGIIELENPLIYNDNIGNIDWASGADFEEALNEEGIAAFAVGWSCSKETISCRLEKLNLVILPAEVCVDNSLELFSDNDRTLFNKTTHFCLSTMLTNYVSEYYGNLYYGSPLVVNGKVAGIKMENIDEENCLYVNITQFVHFSNELEEEGTTLGEEKTIPEEEDITRQIEEEIIPVEEELIPVEEEIIPVEEEIIPVEEEIIPVEEDAISEEIKTTIKRTTRKKIPPRRSRPTRLTTHSTTKAKDVLTTMMFSNRPIVAPVTLGISNLLEKILKSLQQFLDTLSELF